MTCLTTTHSAVSKIAPATDSYFFQSHFVLPCNQLAVKSSPWLQISLRFNKNVNKMVGCIFCSKSTTHQMVEVIMRSTPPFILLIQTDSIYEFLFQQLFYLIHHRVSLMTEMFDAMNTFRLITDDISSTVGNGQLSCLFQPTHWTAKN